jgi:hypothetical protein
MRNEILRRRVRSLQMMQASQTGEASQTGTTAADAMRDQGGLKPTIGTA